MFEVDGEDKIPINRQQPSFSERVGEAYRAVLFHMFEKRRVMSLVEPRTDPDVRSAPNTAFQQCKEFRQTVSRIAHATLSIRGDGSNEREMP